MSTTFKAQFAACPNVGQRLLFLGGLARTILVETTAMAAEQVFSLVATLISSGRTTIFAAPGVAMLIICWQLCSGGYEASVFRLHEQSYFVESLAGKFIICSAIVFVADLLCKSLSRMERGLNDRSENMRLSAARDEFMRNVR